MPWFGSKKAPVSSDPKLISATAISPDLFLSIPTKNDEEDTQPNHGKKKCSTWGRKMGKRKLRKQNNFKRSKSIGPQEPKSTSQDDELIEAEKIINELTDLKKGSRLEAFRNLFRSSNSLKEPSENTKTVQKEESIKPNKISNLPSTVPEIDSNLLKVNEVLPSKPSNKVINEKNNLKNHISRKDEFLLTKEKKNTAVNSVRRVKSFTDLQSHENLAIKTTKHNSHSGTSDENKGCLDESGYISDETQVGRVLSSSVSTITTTTESSKGTKLSLLPLDYQSQSKVDDSLLHLDTSAPSTTSSKDLRRNSWDNSFYRTQSERVIWPPQKNPIQHELVSPIPPASASKTNSIIKNSPLQEQAINRHMKLNEKSFSTMTINQHNHLTNSPAKLTGMKKFQITRKTNLTELTLTQLADSFFMDLIRVCLKKGEAKKMGFSIVGGAGSENCNTGVFIKGILPDGQAAEEGTLRSGDMILAVNGQLISGLMTRLQVIQIIRAVKPGNIIFHVGRKYSSLV